MAKKRVIQDTTDYLSPEGLKGLKDEIAKSLGSPLVWGDDPSIVIQVLPLGYPSLDEAINGGFPLGGISLLIGNQSSGKTTAALLAIKNAQKLGLSTVLIDAEKSFDPKWATALGVDIKSLLVSQPRTGEQAFDIALALVRNHV